MSRSNAYGIRIGQAIAEYRRKNGITLRQLGEQLRVSPQSVHKWEREQNYPDITMLPRIAVLLGVSVAELFDAPDEEDR